MDKSESVVSSEGPALPADKPYWVPDELPVPPPVDETAQKPIFSSTFAIDAAATTSGSIVPPTFVLGRRCPPVFY